MTGAPEHGHASEEPLALPAPAAPGAPVPDPARLLTLLVSLRLAGWVLALVAVGGATWMAGRVLRFQPTTLEGLFQVARHGVAQPLRDPRALTEATGDQHRAARELVREGLMAGRGEKVYRQLLTRTPDHEAYNLELGELLLEAGRYPEAAEFLDRATRVDPESGLAWARLAEARIRLGQLEQGLLDRRKAKQRGVDLRKVDAHLFRIYQAERHYQQAIRFGLRADPDEADAEIQHQLARVYYEMGRPNRWSLTDFRFTWDPAAHQGAQRHVTRCLELDETHRGCLDLRGKL